MNSTEKLKYKHWHKLPAEEVIGFLDVNLSTGLSVEEFVRRRSSANGWIHRSSSAS